MRFHCSVCQELFVDSDVIMAPQCGHTFHHDCIVQWISGSKKSCPTCRQATTVAKLLRIYFDVAPASTGQIDTADLQQQLDDATLKIQVQLKELNELKEERANLKKKSNRYCKEKKEAEEKVRDSEIIVANLQQRVEFLSKQVKSLTILEEELKASKEKLKLMETVQQIVNSTHEEVEQMLDQYGDHSDTAKSLSTQCVILSRELNSKAAAKQKADEELRKCRRQVTNLTVELQRLKREAKEKEEQAGLVEEEVKRYISENAKLQEKLRLLQDSISSPSGDPRNSALSRLLHESPAPFMRLSNLVDSPGTPNIVRKHVDPDRGISLKKPRLMAAEEVASMRPQLTDPQLDSENKGKELQTNSQQSQESRDPQSFRFKRMKFDPSASSSSGYFYDGMGGHSKPDIYPVPSSKLSSQSSTSSQRTIKMNIKGKIQTKTIDLFMTK